ncbi:MAG: phosphoenolpyruvate carboxykinase (ATP) [Myxococcales bacterium]|nr:MAG: phosphoenolpyruvate carboxykinase (ATP) [Myxococcales bacterium]
MPNAISLEYLGLRNPGTIHRNLPVPALVEAALSKNEGVLAENGSLIVRTGDRTGRSPNDKFFVRRSPSAEQIWWGDVNQAVSEDVFNKIWDRAKAHLQSKELFVFDGFVGADKSYRLPLRVVTPFAWHALFAETLFIRPTAADLAAHAPEFTVVSVPTLRLNGKADGANSEVFVAVDIETRLVLIVGTGYAGEIKKSIFTIMNYLLPLKNVMTMHCSANVGRNGKTALFFGLSGTGKTTLSADPARRLIGDDEHGWTDQGVFNFEGGCYAKCIHLSAEAEPQIYNAICFGSVLENVDYDPQTRRIDYDSDSITENTRATYPVTYIPNCILEGTGGHPSDIFFLAADAFGVLPPIARLDNAHALYHFLSGYTAKLAGTEAGVTEPKATFSACFGEPFMPLHPGRYAQLLGERIKKHNVRTWLVNTGWTGGPYGVGRRMSIKHTRTLLNAALNGELDNVAYREDTVFGLQVPTACPGVPEDVLNPRNTWKDKDAYDKKARELAGLFIKNFAKYADGVSEDVRKAAPKG